MPSSSKDGTYFEGFDADLTFEFYEAVRKRLPGALFPKTSCRAGGLLEIAEGIDVFVFDAYGVLNVGSAPIPGAAETVSALRKLGKQVFVLTNAATYPSEHNIQKFRSLGFDFRPTEISSSRMVACNWMAQQNIMRWGVMGMSDSAPQEFGVETRLLADEPEDYDWAEGFLLLSTGEWNRNRQLLSEQAYERRPRALVVANPDVIAPLENGFSTEPGFVAHRIAERFGIPVKFHGKPFPSVFELVMKRMPPVQEHSRIAMVGDTLHTDILGVPPKAGQQF